MTSTRYLTRHFLSAIAVALVTLFSLALLLDLADKAGELAPGDGNDGVLIDYMQAAAPVVLGSVFPAAILIGAMAAFARLARGNEIIGLYASGFGIHHIGLRLLPVTMFLGLVYFLVQALAAPPGEVKAAAILKAHTPPKEEKVEEKFGGRFWIRSGPLFLSFEDASSDGTVLLSPALYERGEDNTLVSRVVAERAVFSGEDLEDQESDEQGWEMKNARESSFQGARSSTETREIVRLDNGPCPNDIMRITTGATLTEFETGARDRDGTWGGAASPGFLETRRQQALASPLTALIMIMAASLMASGSTRHPAPPRDIVGGLILGFGFLLFAGIFGSLGHSGLIHPVLAGWMPTVLFLSLTASFALRKNG